MSITLQTVLRKLENPKPAGNGYYAKCPAHDDKTASLSVSLGNNKSALLNCHAGCTYPQILAALDIHQSQKPAIEKTIEYPIKDVSGKLITTKIRIEKSNKQKIFTWNTHGKNHTLDGLKKVDLPLYGSENIERFARESIVFLCEGEKAAKSLVEIGLQALGTVTGATSTPSKDVLKCLYTFRVILWPDYDKNGLEHMTLIRDRLVSMKIEALFFPFFEAKEKYDAFDYVKDKQKTRTDKEFSDYILRLCDEVIRRKDKRLSNEKRWQKALSKSLKETEKSYSFEEWQKEKAAQQKEIDDFIKEINEDHAVVFLGETACILRESIDKEKQEQVVNFITRDSFNLFHANRKFLQNGKDVSGPKLWIESEKRRTYTSVTFDPNHTVEEEKTYNLWKGFTYQPKPGDWSLFREHIRDNICSGDETCYQWVMAFMADCVQVTPQRPGVSLVLLSPEKGTGKTFFCKHFGKLFGKHYFEATQKAHILGKHNDHLKHTILLTASEAIWAGDKEAEGALKGLITDEEMNIEPKFKSVFKIKNRIRMIFPSNNAWVVPVGLDQRRFCVLRVAIHQKQNKPYFTKIEEQLKNGGYEAMLHSLLTLPIKNFNLNDIPKTQALLEQKEESMSDIQVFYYQLLKNGQILDDRDFHDPIQTRLLYDIYLEQAKNISHSRKYWEIQLAKQLKQLCPPLKKKKLTSSFSLGQVWHFLFPPIDVARKEFEAIIGQEITW